MHGNTYTPQSLRIFFVSSHELVCLSQMSFQVVKVSRKATQFSDSSEISLHLDHQHNKYYVQFRAASSSSVNA